jgi:hypothetical protein
VRSATPPPFNGSDQSLRLAWEWVGLIHGGLPYRCCYHSKTCERGTMGGTGLGAVPAWMMGPGDTSNLIGR